MGAPFGLKQRSGRPAENSELPLGGEPFGDRTLKCSAAAEGEAVLGETYHRLFGTLTPEQVMAPDNPSRSSGVDGTYGPPVLFCDPKDAAGHLSVSTRTLADIAALRARHIEKGHTPEADAAHGWHHFKQLSDQAFRDAIGARSPETRRTRLIIAAAIIVALIDAEDFQAQQQEPTP